MTEGNTEGKRRPVAKIFAKDMKTKRIVEREGGGFDPVITLWPSRYADNPERLELQINRDHVFWGNQSGYYLEYYVDGKKTKATSKTAGGFPGFGGE